MSFINQDAEICAISEVTSILIIYFLHISKDTLGNLGNLFLAKAKKKKKSRVMMEETNLSPTVS